MLSGMEPEHVLDACRSAVGQAADRLAQLIRPLPDLEQAVAESEWTARDAVAHLITALDLYTEMALGTPSPVPAYDVAVFAEFSRQRIADVPEADPTKLAYLLVDAADRFCAALSGSAGDAPVRWHAGMEIPMAQLAGLMLGEIVLHGYDIAVASRRPWPLQPNEVALILGAYAPLLGLNVDVERTRGLTAAFGVEVRGVASFVVRFTDGRHSLEPAGSGPVDCTLSADPAAFLLVTSGRLARWPAIALGLLGPGGDRPDMAVGFKDLYVFP